MTVQSTPASARPSPGPQVGSAPGTACSSLRLSVDHEDLTPHRAFASDAGLDLKSAMDLTLAPGSRAVVPTGVRIALAEGTVGLVCPRSGLAAKHGISIVNAPGVVDAGYRGEVKVTLINTDTSEPFTIARGDRIAQLLVMPVIVPILDTVDSVEGDVEAERGERGFGSSGGFAGQGE